VDKQECLSYFRRCVQVTTPDREYPRPMDASNRSLGLGHQAGALQPLAPQKPGFVTGGVGPQEAKLREELHAFLAGTALM